MSLAYFLQFAMGKIVSLATQLTTLTTHTPTYRWSTTPACGRLWSAQTPPVIYHTCLRSPVVTYTHTPPAPCTYQRRHHMHYHQPVHTHPSVLTTDVASSYNATTLDAAFPNHTLRLMRPSTHTVDLFPNIYSSPFLFSTLCSHFCATKV
jgi:hypothetical protein